MNSEKQGAAGLRGAQTRSARRRIAAVLRAAHRVVGLRRKRLALGVLAGSGSRVPGGTAVVVGGVVAMLTSTMALTPLPARANVISADGTCGSSGSNPTVGRIPMPNTVNGPSGLGYPLAGGSGTYSLAAGCSATVDVSVLGGTAYGGFATVTGQGGIAVGFNSQAGTWSLAVGLETRATSAGSTAVGFGSQALSANSIAIGGAGGDGTTPLSVANSTIANAAGSIAIGANASRGAQTGGTDSIAVGGQSTVASGATSGIAIGRGATVSAAATYGVAQGDGATAQSANDIALGRGAATASGSTGSNIALGNGAVAGSGTAANAIAIGKGSQATGASSLSIGMGNKVSGANSGAIGDPTTITGAGSYSLGNNNTINANKAFVVGSNVTVATGLDGSIVLGDGSTIAAPSGTGYATGAAAPASQMSVGAAGAERRITNLAAGSAATDAVNVSQLSKIAGNTASTTGGSYDAAGTYTAPTLSVGGTAQANLAAAVNAQDAIVQNQGSTTASTLGAGATYTASTGAISGFSQPINSVSTTGAVGATSNQTTVGAALGALNTDVVNTANIAVKYDSAGGSTVTLGATGGSGAPVAGVRITNLTPGTLSASSTDAVNGGQLFVTNSNVTTLTNNVANGTIGPVQQTTVANSLVLVEPGKTGGNPGAAQTLGNLAAGVQNSSSLQAVNASQLFTTGRSVATVLGGSAAYNPGIQVGITGFSQPINGIDTVGTVNAPTSQTTVAGALTALNNNTANTANIAVKYDSATSPAQITLGATGGTLPAGQGTVKITNLTAGSAATDAVNVSQLQVVQTLGSAYRHVNSVRTGANSNDGSNSGATGQDAIAVGVGERASGAGALAIGGLDINPSGPPSYFSANAAGDRSIALGVSATAGVSAQDSIAIGSYSTASGAGTVYVGTGAGQGATGDNSIGIGASAGYNQSGLRNLSIGNGAGTLSSGQRNTYIGSLNTGMQVTGDFNTAIGSQALASSTGSIGSQNTAIGMQAGQNTNGNSNTVIGAFAGRSVTGSDNIAVGNNAGSGIAAYNTISIGKGAYARADGAIAIGADSTASLSNSVVLGNASVDRAATAVTGTAIGGHTYSFAGAGSVANGVVSVGTAFRERQIINLAAGEISATSTDAINGSQLFATNQAVDALGTQTTANVNNLGSTTAGTLGAGSTYDPATGKISAFNQPITNITSSGTVGTTVGQTTVAAALTALDANTTNLANTLTSGTIGPVQRTSTANQLALIASGGSASAPGAAQTLTNLAAGAVTATSTDGINGGQLFGASQSVATSLGGGSVVNTDGTISAPSYTIGTTTYGNVGSALNAINTSGIKFFHANSTLADSQATGTDSISVGPTALAGGDNSLALGKGARTAGGAAGGIALGNAAAVSAADGIAIGTGATSGATGSNIAIGSGNTAAIAGSAAGGAVAIGFGQRATGDGAVAIGDPNVAAGTGAVALGANNTAAGNVGGTIAANGAVAMGNANTAIGQGSVALGNSSSVAAAGGVALGDTAKAQGGNGVALGSNATAANANDVALGSGAATAAAVGTASTTIAGKSYAFAGAAPTSTVSVGSLGAERTITNLAAGRLSASSTDAVNGSQLFATNQAVDALGTQTTINLNNLGTTTASTLGAGATYDPATGKISAFSQPITNITSSGAVGTTVGQTTVAGALTALDANTTNLANNLTSGTIGPVQRTTTLNQLTLVAPTGSAGTPGAAQTLSNLAAGVAATDAVNVSQLQAVQTLGNAYRNVNSVRTGANSNDGSNSGAVGQDAIAVGVGVRASGTGALAIGGMDNNPSGPASYISANAAGNRSIALGVGATTGIAALNGIAIGSGSVANAPSAIYIGTGAGQSATGNDNSIGIGASAGNAQSGLTNLSVGVNAGSSSSGQRNTYVGSLNTGGRVAGDFNTAIGSQAMFSSVGSTGSSNTAVGMQAGQNINGNTNTVLGAFSGRFVTGSDNVAVGNNAGSGITASGTVSIGRQAMASAAGAIAIGTDSAASLSNSVVLGNASTDRAATTVTGTTIGGQTYTFAGAGSVANGVVSVGAAGKERQIINLAAGEISATSTDAINGSQLFATNTAVTNIASGATGTVQRTPAANELALVAPGGSGAAPGAVQTLTNLAPGALNATSTEAVNGSQLFATNANVATLTTNANNLGSTTASTLGGGATYDPATGKVAGFSQPINGISTTGAVATSTPQTTVADALAALNTNAVNLANIAVKYDAVGGNTITLGAIGGTGGPAGGVKIANLMAGTADSDAANVGQLKAITPHYLSVNDGNQVRGNYDNKGATGIYGIAIGADAASIGAAGVAMGKDAAAHGSHTVAIGMSAGSGSSSPGSIANVAIGADSGRDVSGQVNTAVGYAAGTTVNGTGNVATGTSSGLSVTGDYNAAFGSQSGSIVVGFNNLAMGTNAGFTVSGSLNTASGANSGQNVAGDRNSAMGPFAGRFVTGSDNVALGTNAGSDITADRTVSIGRLAMASAADAVAIGTGSIASASGAISIGKGNIVSGIGSAAIGDPNTVSGSGSYAIGNNNTIAQNNSFVLGNSVTTTQANSVVLGNASADRAATTVTGATIGGTSYTFAGAGSAANGVASVGGVGTERQIVNLAAGELSATSTDAVNGSQLFATNQAVTSIASGTTGPVQRTPTADQLALVAPGGSGAAPGAAQTLTNLAPGALNATSTDAVNGSQLFATNASVTSLTTNANNLGSTTASTLGGGATYDPATGKVAGFSQSITNVNPNGAIGTTIGQTTVAGALTALDVNTTNLANNLTNGAIGPVQRTVAPNQLTLVAPGGTAAAPGAAQTLTNLAPAALSATSTEAVNGSQLFATNVSVTSLATNANNLGSATASTLGSGATYDPATGKVAGFSQPITGISTTGAVGVAAKQTTVGDALAALNANAVNLANVAVKYDAAGGNTITLGATGGAGGPAGGVKITNLTAGTLSATSTDAVNGSQLYATNQTVTNISNGQVGAFGSNQATTKAQPVASGTDALAGGFGASATGAASSVVGNNATDNGVANSTVMGNGAGIAAGLTGSNVALGQGSIVASNAVGTSSAAVGGTTYNFAGAAPAGTVSVGSVGAERTVTNVAAGRLSAASTDAVNGSQLFATNSAVDQLNTQVTSINNGAAGPVQRTGAANQLVLVAPGGSAAAPGAAQTLTNLAAGALSATSTDAVTGSQLHATNQSLSNIQNGGGIKYFHANSTAADSQAVGVGSVAAGPQSVATGTNSVALGNGTAATNAGDVALGSGSTTAAAVGTASGTVNGTVYSYAGANPTSTVSVGSAGSERTVTNVAAGRVTAMSTDAVNGSQLFATNSAVNSLATSLGDGGQNAVRYDRDGTGQKTNTVTLLGGDPNAPVLIKNVATGVSDSDAANVGQVKAVSAAATTVANSYTDMQVGAALQTAVSYTNQVAAQTLQQANSYTDMRFGQLSQQIGEVQKEARQAAAIGLAASSLRYDERPGKLSAAVGGGVWKGYAAGSMGLGYTSRDQNVRANVSATTTGDSWGIGAGLSFTLN